MDWETYLEKQRIANERLQEAEVLDFSKALGKLRDQGGFLWVGGNGGSSATASHAAADLTKTITQKGAKPLVTLALSEALSLTTASANDLSFEKALANSAALMARPGDAVLVISVSGTSPNLVALINEAKSKNLITFAMVGAAGREAAKNADHAIVVDSADYQIVENTHLFLLHWFVKFLE